jgi:nicotinate-nucleotide adenylyltransferase
MRIGVFGGSFDPVHVGHQWIAEAALETLALDEVRWIPAATSPLKRGGPVAPDADRLEMVRLAVGGTDGHLVDAREIERGGVSFTADTLAELAESQPEAERFLIIGSDALVTFPHWRAPEQLLTLATLAVVRRGGEPPIDFSVLDGVATDGQLAAARRSVIQMPLIELSSTELRERVAEGRRIRFRVPRAVEALIAARGLYRSP